MPRIPTAELSKTLLDMIYDEFHIWEKINQGSLTSAPVAEADAPSHHYPGATSKIIKHHLNDGKHIATTHYIVSNDGQVLHWDAKDFRMHDIRLWRA